MALKVDVELDVPARMRDGVTLRADVYRPAGGGPWPTLLTRTPYGKHVFGEVAWCGLDPVQVARRGFMVVVQDTRGRFASEGEWVPFRFERADGYDSIEWAARLPGASGRVAMYGGSYCGNTQWMPALDRPPSLVAISPSMTWSEPMAGLFARGGAVELGLAVRWALETGIDHVPRLGVSSAQANRRVEAIMDEWDRLARVAYWELPISDAAVLRRHSIPDLGGLPAVNDPAIADWCRVAGSYERINLPTFHTAGWHDIFLQGTLDSFEAMRDRGHDARLVVGPWSHVAFGDPVGEQIFGIRAGRDGVPIHGGRDWNELQLAWFRRHLEPAADIEPRGAPVRLFVMGHNTWRDEQSWPLARASHQRWYLHGNGSVSPTPPSGDQPPREFVYDPMNPVPTVGGPGVMSPHYATGPVEQAHVEKRDDVLVFSSQPLSEELEVTGRVRLVLHAESTASSTDWIARLCDVDPDGRSFNLCDGVVRIGQGADAARRVEIDLWSTSNVFLRGHRLRVQVTSSCFPRWDRNLNTGNQGMNRHEIARQRVFVDAHRASHVELPIVG